MRKAKHIAERIISFNKTHGLIICVVVSFTLDERAASRPMHMKIVTAPPAVPSSRLEEIHIVAWLNK